MAGRSFLDPSAQEFHPHFAFTIPHIYNSYPSLTPRPPSAVHPSHASSDSPTRSVLLSLLPPHATESLLRSSMQLFGGVRAVEMGLDAATATVHFFDLRSAQAAVAEVQSQHMRRQHQQIRLLRMGPPDEGRGLVGGHVVWAQFGRRSVDDDSPNQGSLFVFNSDPVSADQVRDIFQVFGSVKEVRETPSNLHKKFVEFFDVRDAARALEELNSKKVLGTRLLVEFSRLGGVGASFQRRTNYSGRHNLPVPPRFRGFSSSQSSSSSTEREGGSRSKMGEKSIMLLREGDVIREGNSSNSPPPSSSKQPQQQQQSSNKKRSKKFPKNSGGDSRFLFKEVELAIESESSSSCIGIGSGSNKDFRTTVMIKNIPNKYSQKLLLNMLDNHCIHCNEKVQQNGLSAYDFVYLPIDFSNKCNVGYGFVNMTTPEATVRLYRAFHNQPWEVFNSRKICQVTYARLQGLEALKEHFKNSKFPCDNDEYMPVVFSPPRDGDQLTVPLPVGGRCSGSFRNRAIGSTTADLSGTAASSTTISTSTSTRAQSDEQADGDDGRDENDGGLCEQFLQLSYTAEG